MIHHCCFWEFKPYILEVANLLDMVREVVQEINDYKVKI